MSVKPLEELVVNLG
jgi:hypothetical protein